MPWQETGPMTERMHFVVALEAGEASMAEVCRRFGISRKTGYKWWARYVASGIDGLTDRSRAPHHCPHTVPAEIRELIIAFRGRHPTWGPKKLAVKLGEQHPDLVIPAPSTIGDLLTAAGLVVPRRRRRHAPPRTQPLAHATAPNVVWCADFKGDFLLGNGTRCYPLTISDAHSRFLLRCQALPTTAGDRAQPLFEATFREYGLPDVLRTDNGSPFGSVGAGGLTPLSVWWIKLGLEPERIDPGKPSQNGRHERMHLTLKTEACQQPAHSLRGQQQRFDTFRSEYNQERPHEALGQRPPATVYQPSFRPFPDRLPELTYPEADAVRLVRPNGAIRWHGAEVYVTQTLAGEPVGLTEVTDGAWQVGFGPVVLGVIPHGRRTLVTVQKPRRHHESPTTTTTTTTMTRTGPAPC